jgi:type IV pilus assembly protein PilQ
MIHRKRTAIHTYTALLVALLIIFPALNSLGQIQAPDRFQIIEQRLKDLSSIVPGLKEKADLSVSNGSLQEFLKGLAATHDLNFNIDPSLTQRVNNYFSEEPVINILVFLAKQYNLDLTFVGSIITIAPYKDPLAGLPPPPKEIKVQFNSFSQLITLDLNDDTLLNVAKKITQVSGKNVMVLPELYYRKVTGYIQDLPVTGALEKLALTNDFKLNATNDNALILEPLKQDEEIITRPNPIPNPNFSIRKVTKNGNTSGSATVEVNDDRYGHKTISMNVTNAPIKDVIRNISEQAGINYFVYSDLAGYITANVTNMPFERALGFILQQTRYTYSLDNGVYMIGDRKEEGLRSKKLIQLQYRSVDSLVSIIPQELKQGIDIKEFKELNSFLVSGSEPQIKEIEAFIKQLDKVVPMITIEVILMDINKTKAVSTGITAGVSDSAKIGGYLLGAPSGGLNYTFSNKDINQFLSSIGLNNVFNLGKVSPNFYLNISAMESKNNVEVHQTPKLSTLNGHTANLSIGSTRYYSVSTQNVIGSLNPQTVVTQQFIPVEANMSIDILPIVSGDDQVTLTITVNITDFTSSSTAINTPPPTSTSKFKSIIRIRNEEMILLGGIERTEKNEIASGVPLLSRIPILKWLFSSRTKSNSKVVSVVFIRPKIIYY